MRFINYLRPLTFIFLGLMGSLSGCNCLSDSVAPQTVSDLNMSSSGDYVLFRTAVKVKAKTPEEYSILTFWAYQPGKAAQKISEDVANYGSFFDDAAETVIYTKYNSDLLYWYNLKSNKKGVVINNLGKNISSLSFENLRCNAVIAKDKITDQTNVGWINPAKNEIKFTSINTNKKSSDFLFPSDCHGAYWINDGDIFSMAQYSEGIEAETENKDYQKFYFGTGGELIGLTTVGLFDLNHPDSLSIPINADISQVLTQGVVVMGDQADLITYDNQHVYLIDTLNGDIDLLMLKDDFQSILQVIVKGDEATVVDYQEMSGFNLTTFSLDSLEEIRSTRLDCFGRDPWGQSAAYDAANHQLLMICREMKGEYDYVYAIDLATLEPRRLTDKKWKFSTLRAGNGFVILNKPDHSTGLNFTDYGEVLYSIDLKTGKLKNILPE